MMRKALLVSLIGLALLAGPLAASCASCCRPLEAPATLATAGCCECAQTVQRPAIPDSSVSERCASPEALAMAALPVPVPARAVALLVLHTGDPAFSPPSAPTPRRL